MLKAQIDADNSTIKLDMVKFFKDSFNCKWDKKVWDYQFFTLFIRFSFVLVSLNYKLVKTLDPLHLEMSLQSALLDKRFHLASLTIAAAYRGIRTRRALTNLLRTRKQAILFIQDFVRKRQARLRKEQ